MAADFFERQDAARRNTSRLVVLFVLAVLAIIVSIHLLLGFAFGYLSADPRTGAIDWTVIAEPGLLALSIAATLLVVGGGSLFKIAQLRAGGRVVAEELGGRLLNPDSANPTEQRLLNIVEEMAIASGTPVPPVYLLDGEDSINAFAAGFTPGDAVVGVTKGTAERLTRDELQGVIAHEFSHIVNGDMRLNIRLIGLLHGILIVGILGYYLLRMAIYSGAGRRRSRDGNPLPLVALGAGLMAVGFFGTFFGNLIKAAVSRQREFLADAAAVQFTRQPEGIAGALKKIGGLFAGSSIQNPNAPEASHLFFGRATTGLSGLFSTHPPLQERIRRIEPSWDGTYLDAGVVAPAAAPAAGVTSPGRAAAPVGAGAPLAAAAAVGLAGAVEHIGRPGQAHLQHAARLIEGVPPVLRQAAHEAFGARAVVYALLLDRDAEVRRRQLHHLSTSADPHVFEETLKLVPAVVQLDVRRRLPLLELTLPALRELTARQYERFRENLAALMQADAAISLFEWSLHHILVHDLQSHEGRPVVPRVRYRSLSGVLPQIEILLSLLAHAGQRDASAAGEAFAAAGRTLQAPQARLRPPTEATLPALDAALSVLEETTPAIKRQILHAAVACITYDRTVTATEAELLRAFAASLDCPMPPILET